VHQHAAQHRVLDDVGKIAGVIGVTIVHIGCVRAAVNDAVRSV
jgi:hypothetical protein